MFQHPAVRGGVRAAREWLRAPTAWLCLLLCAASVVAFVVIASEHAWLCDDAFISFRYSDNIVSGFGAVFNRGEPVEGYTNFLWVLELAALNWLTRVPMPLGSQVLSWAFSAFTIVLAIVLATRPSRADSGKRRWVVAATMVLLLTERGFGVWTTSGLETRQFTFFVLLGLALVAEGGDHQWARIAGSVTFGLAELTRPEGLMLGAIGIGGFLLERLLARRFSLRAFLEVVTPAAAMIVTHYVWRHSYYGDWLPNTYYAKHVRPWWDMGLRYIGAFGIEGGVYLLLPLAIAGAALRFRRERPGFVAYGLVAIVAQCQYIAQIGGDHFEFRPFDFFWVPLSVGASEAIVWAAHGVGRRTRAWAGGAVYAVLLALLLAHVRVLELAQWRGARTRLDRNSSVGMVVHVDAANAPEAFALPLVKALIPTYDDWLTKLAGRSIALRHQEHKIFFEMMNGFFAPYRRYASGRGLPSGAILVHGNIGAISYSLPSFTVVDAFGLTDHTIARNPVKHSNEYRVMAHDRGPPPGYLDQRGVNIVVEPSVPSLERARLAGDYALELGPDTYMPFRSGNKAWVRSAFARLPVWGNFLEPGAPEATEVWEGPFKWRGFSTLGAFDGGLDGWTTAGLNGTPSVASGPQPLQRAIEGRVGSGLINSYGAELLDEATGVWVSPSFIPQDGDSLLFLVGGGAVTGVGVSLLDGSRAVATYSGSNDERLRPVRVDLGPFKGKSLTVRVFDETRAGWGHILADHFVLLRPSG